jgi:putative transcriptional regulator
MAIAVDIDVMLARRKMSVGELADRVGITPANLAVLKNGRAKAVRFATLAALCEALDCQPGDLLRWEPDAAGDGGSAEGLTTKRTMSIVGGGVSDRIAARAATAVIVHAIANQRRWGIGGALCYRYIRISQPNSHEEEIAAGHP